VPDTALAAIDAFIESESVDTSSNLWRMSLSKPQQAEFDSDSSYFWDLETSAGNISIRLLPDEAPMHATSTIYLTRLGFYDGLIFHRVITQFMAQGGCPAGSGTSGPGYQYDGEFGSRKHDQPGLLSMANAGPGTDGSQFFLTFVPTPWLDSKHTIFGEVVEGMDAVQKLEMNGSEDGKPQERIELTSATIRVE
jgi:cyclophilin family peptidyl-prolyl cis-trans isomerase